MDSAGTRAKSPRGMALESDVWGARAARGSPARAEVETVEEYFSSATWIAISNGTLGVNDTCAIERFHGLTTESDVREDLIRDGVSLVRRERMERRDGVDGTDDFAGTTSQDVVLERLVKCMRSLNSLGMDPSWIFMYDDAWRVAERFRSSAEDVFGGCVMNFDVLAWFVDPKHDKTTTAFAPHRDRQPDDAPKSFRADGTAKYNTVWFALTDATPRNSCLYCLPRGIDPGYFDGDSDDINAPSPLELALKDKAAYQSIRALPINAGGAVFFTHRLIHWGSVGDGADIPRLSLSFGFADPDFEPPYLKVHNRRVPTVAERAGLIAGQLIAYHERFPPSSDKLRQFKRIFDTVKSSFHETYVKKINFEYAKATLNGENVAGDDGIDDALDAMLDNADDFEDDFDDDDTILDDRSTKKQRQF